MLFIPGDNFSFLSPVHSVIDVAQCCDGLLTVSHEMPGNSDCLYILQGQILRPCRISYGASTKDITHQSVYRKYTTRSIQNTEDIKLIIQPKEICNMDIGSIEHKIQKEEDGILQNTNESEYRVKSISEITKSD